jgi:hypothetical protein
MTAKVPFDYAHNKAAPVATVLMTLPISECERRRWTTQGEPQYVFG